MDGHKHAELSDETLEREIEAAFGVDPSPEFLPRIRARIASERVHEGWAWSAPWRWAAAGVMVAAVAGIGLWIGRDEAPAQRETRIADASPVEPAPEAAAPAVSPDPVVVPVVRAAHSPERVAVKKPEVLISQDEAVALRQLMVAITARQVEATDIPQLGAESAPLPPIEEIVLEPIKLSPLAGLETE